MTLLLDNATAKTARRRSWRQVLTLPFAQTSPKLLEAANTSLFSLPKTYSLSVPSPEFLRRDADPAPDSLLIAAAQVRRGGESNREARAGSGRLPPPTSAARARRRDACRSCAGLCRLPGPRPPPLRPSPEPAPRPRGSAPPALPRHLGPRDRAGASVREVRGGGTYQLLPDPAPHAPAVAVPVPRDAGAEGLQVEAEEPEGEAGEPLRLKFRSPSLPPHSPRRGPISPRRPRGPTGAVPAPPPPGAAESAAAPQPPSLLTDRCHPQYRHNPTPGPTRASPRRPGPPPDVTKLDARTEGSGSAAWVGKAARVEGGRASERGVWALPPPLISGVGFSRVGVSVYRACSSWPTPLFLPPDAGLLLVLFCLLWFPQPPDTHTQDQECSD